MKNLRIAINGAAGRMGRQLIAACVEAKGLELAAAFEHADSDFLGIDAGELASVANQGVKVVSDIESNIDQFDAIIDFTRPHVTLDLLPICEKHNKKLIIGTTGFDEAGKQALRATAEHTAVVFAPNMSVGVNLTFKLLEMAAKAIGDDTDIEIIESHHRRKVDAPSGTALGMGEAIAGALGRDLAKCAVYSREGITGEREDKTIGFQTIRGGDIIGEHTAMFISEGERVEITHKASSRMNFAFGAMRAAKWLSDKNSGLFDMQDVLGLK